MFVIEKHFGGMIQPHFLWHAEHERAGVCVRSSVRVSHVGEQRVVKVIIFFAVFYADRLIASIYFQTQSFPLFVQYSKRTLVRDGTCGKRK